MKQTIHLLFFVCFVAYGSAQDISHKERFDEAIGLYQNNKYQQSLDIFKDLLAKNIVTADVYYNIANCYAKLEDIPNAILAYERALKLAPFDQAISHNLLLVTQKIGVEIVDVPDFYLLQVWEDFTKILRSNYWTYLFILFGIAFLVFFYKWLLGKDRKIKKRSFFLAIAAIFLCVLCFFASRTKYQMEYGQDTAIVMTEELYLKSGPDSKSKDQRLLKGGVKVELIDKIGLWYKVKLANNETGWLEMNTLEII